MDIVIPLIEKDLPVFPHCINGLRCNILHPIKNIFVVAPKVDQILDACDKLNCRWVDELEVLPEGPEYYRKHLGDRGHEGGAWLYQQFLKFTVGDTLGLERYLVFDSDTVLINPYKFIDEGKTIFSYSDGYRKDLDWLNSKLLKGMRLYGFSFMCHFMLMEKDLVGDLLRQIEQITSRSWKQGVLDSIDYNEIVCFSEFELYANFALNKSPTDYKLMYWFNKSLNRRQLPRINEINNQEKGNFLSLSFHSYNS